MILQKAKETAEAKKASKSSAEGKQPPRKKAKVSQDEEGLIITTGLLVIVLTGNPLQRSTVIGSDKALMIRKNLDQSFDVS